MYFLPDLCVWRKCATEAPEMPEPIIAENWGENLVKNCKRRKILTNFGFFHGKNQFERHKNKTQQFDDHHELINAK